MPSQTCPKCSNTYQVPDWMTGAGKCPHCAGGSVPSGGPVGGGPVGGITNWASAVEPLRKTKPWVRFLSVVMYICNALLVIAGVFSIIGAGRTENPPILIGAGIGYILFAILYFFPAYFVWGYANRIQEFAAQPTERGLVAALSSQKKIWKFVGIVTLIVLCIYGVLLVAGLGAGISNSINIR